MAVIAATVTITATRSYTSSDLTLVISSAYSVTSCHFHGNAQYCIDEDGVEGSILPTPSATGNAPQSYTGCHSHGTQTYCLDSSGEEYLFAAEGSDSISESEDSSESSGQNCHFHAGVEHCVGENESEDSGDFCERIDRDYNIRLRIGLLFVILATSALGSFSPIFLTRFCNLNLDGIIITVLKQFGTGVIISTAFVHLMTHAQLMWGNSCIALGYEATAASITMAGIFLTFIIEYSAHRIADWRASKDIDNLKGNSQSEITHKNSTNEKDLSLNDSAAYYDVSSEKDSLKCILLEAGIVFHSVLIGVTLVVAGDSFFITLFIVIVFHQFFEGIALGSRIAGLDSTRLPIKLIMALVYALVTPIGMAIGIGVLNKFNGNDPSTIIALGTLDSFSAGILIWTGLVEMLFHDWFKGTLKNASFFKTIASLVALLAGLILMSVLGKWA